jgi:hypothetical protein
MIRLEKQRKKFFFDYEKVENHLAYMRKKNSGVPVGPSPIKTLLLSAPEGYQV